MDSLDHVFVTDKRPPSKYDRRHLEELASLADRLTDWCELEVLAGRETPVSFKRAVQDMTAVYNQRVNPPAPNSLRAALANVVPSLGKGRPA